VWNKRSDEMANPERPAQPDPAYAAPVAGVSRPPAYSAGPPSNKAATIIGASMRIKGDIIAQEELQVNGEIEGRLESQSSITVGPNGNVSANVRAQDLIIMGSLRGNVEVLGKITIREQGSLVGDIKAAGITIDDGAYFKGSIDIVRPEPQFSKPGRAESAPPQNVPATPEASKPEPPKPEPALKTRAMG
jgi:cytoskeletal protein CcmA (bactofilin family)